MKINSSFLKSQISFFLLVVSYFSGTAQDNFQFQESEILKGLEAQTINLSKLEEAEVFYNIKGAYSKHGTAIDQKKLELDAQRAKNSSSNQMGTLNQSFKKQYTPKITASFEGNFSSGGTPADNNLAVSNDGIVVTAINSNIRVMTEDGETLMAKTLSSLARSLGNLSSAYDPHLIYDPDADKFILIFLSGYSSANTNLILGVTAGSDPTEDWHFYKLPGNVHSNNTWSDYPFIAISNDEIVIPVLLWKNGESGWDSEAEEIIWQIEKTGAYTGEELTYKYYDKISINGRKVWNTRPVAGSMGAYGPHLFLIGNRAIDNENDSFFLFKISNTIASGQATLTYKVAKSNLAYGIPPSAIQTIADDPLRTNYADIHSAYWHYGRIHFVGNSLAKSTQSAGIYYGIMSDLDSENPTVEAQIFNHNSLDLNYPSMAYIGGGGIDRSFLINCLHSGANVNPGTSTLYIDRDGKFSSLLTVKEGESGINVMSNNDLERWGDYTGCQRQYNKTGVAWLAGSFGKNNRQATWISRVESTDPRLGISETAEVKAHLYPNPAYDLLRISLSILQAGKYQLAVYNSAGQLVENLGMEPLAEGDIQLQLDVSKFISGIYYLRLSSENEQLTQQFLVSR